MLAAGDTFTNLLTNIREKKNVLITDFEDDRNNIRALSQTEDSKTAGDKQQKQCLAKFVFINCLKRTRSISNMLGPFAKCEPPLHCQSPGVASRTPAIAIAQAACDVHNDNDDNA